MRGSRLLLLCTFVVATTLALRKPCNAQRRPYVGVVGGVSTLSADAHTDLDSNSATTSSYKPENGATAGVFVGLHWNNYFSIQADYLWNRNLLTLDSLAASTTGAGATLYELIFQSRQHTALGSALLYFRPQSSWVRPFLAVGTGVVYLTARASVSGYRKRNQ